MPDPCVQVGDLLIFTLKAGRGSEIDGGGTRAMQRFTFGNRRAVEERSDFGIVGSPVELHAAAVMRVFRRRHAAAMNADPVLQRGFGVQTGESIQLFIAGVTSAMLLEDGGTVQSEGRLEGRRGRQRERPYRESDGNGTGQLPAARDARRSRILSWPGKLRN